MSEIPRLTVTIKEARAVSGLSHGQIYEAMNAGILESRKVLGRRLIIYSSLERLLLFCADNRPPSAFREKPRGDGNIFGELTKRVPRSRRKGIQSTGAL